MTRHCPVTFTKNRSALELLAKLCYNCISIFGQKYKLIKNAKKEHYEAIKTETGERYSIFLSDTDEYDFLYIREIES